MAPFNLEKNMREKLENRELNPSPDAWKKLEAQLGKSQSKKKTVGWYYIAASLVGLLIAASVFLNSNTTEIENKVVKENIQQKDDIQHNDEIEMRTEIVSNVSNPSAEKNLSEESKTGKDPKETTKNLKPLPTQKESAVDKKIKKSEMIADVPKDDATIHFKKSEEKVILEHNIVFNTKVDEVVASVKFLQEKNQEVTAEEVETLLNNARRDIRTQRILSSPKVDATALLQDVEWELEKSFRDKVFDALGEGFNRIRTAVLERND